MIAFGDPSHSYFLDSMYFNKVVMVRVQMSLT